MLYEDFSEFYRSPSGVAVKQSLQKHINQLWNFSKRGEDNNRVLLGAGFSEPYVDSLSSFFERDLLVTSHEGDLDINRICVAEMGSLPFGDMSVDNVLCVHGLEFAEDIDSVISEFWRVLVVGGRLLLVVPLSGFRRGAFGWGDRVGYFELRKFGFEIVGRRLNLLRGGIILLDCRKVFIDDGLVKNRVVRSRYFVPRLRPV